MNYYQFHISDWVLHTSHLTLEEEGVYRRLLDFYYDTEKPIPKETQPVIRRLRLGSHAETVALILAEFFHLEEDGWHNNRADIEIAAYQANADRARENGKKGGRPKKNSGLETQSVISGNPEETTSKANHKPITINQEPLNTTANAVVCSEPSVSKPAADDSAVFISIPTNKFNTEGEERPITENKISEWQAVYPAVDVRQTIFRIRSWVVNNPNKRKTYGGIFKFIDTWLAREQNSGGNGHATNQQHRVAGAGFGKVSHSNQVRADAREALERLNGGDGNPPVRSTG